jgi:hypothetical protein
MHEASPIGGMLYGEASAVECGEDGRRLDGALGVINDAPTGMVG